jgi:hypothetical protein
MATGSIPRAAGLLKARRWSVRLLLIAAVSMLAAVVYGIWFTVSYMGTSAATSAQPDGPDLDLSQRALRFLSYGSYRPLPASAGDPRSSSTVTDDVGTQEVVAQEV